MDKEQSSCTSQSLAKNESLAGTAVASTPHWLLMERRDRWGRKVLDAPDLSDGLIDWVSSFGETIRPQWIRKPQRAEDDLVRVFLALLEGPNRGVWTTELSHLDDLTANEPESLLSDPESCGWVPWAGPLYLVCTHGKRDQCCALAGMPVYLALEGRVGDRVWQTSHVGGHRFAANVVVLPSGYCYGRVQEEQVDALVDATAQGEIFHLNHLRGHVALPQAAQAAEIVAREWLGLLSFQSLTCLDVTEDERGVYVRFSDEDDDEHTAVVSMVETDERLPFSCGDELLRPVIRYEVTFLEEEV